MDTNLVSIYVDGSFNDATGCASWAFIVVKDDKIIHQNKGRLVNKIYNEGRQIAGECKAVIEGIKYCKINHKVGDFHFDYTGLRGWLADIWGEKPWKTNKIYTQKYRDFCMENKAHIRNFIKIKSHTGNFFNEAVDQLAKQR